jgi:hypothetical protein
MLMRRCSCNAHAHVMHAFMCTCTYACTMCTMCACMMLCACLCAHVHIYVHVQICIYVCIVHHVCTHVCTYMCTHLPIYMRACYWHLVFQTCSWFSCADIGIRMYYFCCFNSEFYTFSPLTCIGMMIFMPFCRSNTCVCLREERGRKIYAGDDDKDT